MTRKNLLTVTAILLFLPTLVFTLPQLAVLDAVLEAGIDPAAGPLVTSRIEEAFVNSGKYTVLDRANIDRVLREKEFQLSSGIVRNEEVRQAGDYLGADLVVVASVSRIGQTFVVSAKMIDVVTGQIAAQTSADQAGRIDVLLEVARTVGGRLAGLEVITVSPDQRRAQEIVKEAPPPKEEPVKEEEYEEYEEQEYLAPRPRPKPWEKRFIAGVRAGLNGSTVAWEDYYLIWTGALTDFTEPYPTYGTNVELYLVANTSRFLAWQVGLGFSQKGYGADLEEDGFRRVAETLTFNYLEIPLLAKFRIPGALSPYGLLGVYFALWSGGSWNKDYVDFDTEEEGDLEDFFAFNSLDFGWVLGLGLDLYLGSLVLNTELKYSAGVLYVTPDEIFRNAALSLTVGVGWAF